MTDWPNPEEEASEEPRERPDALVQEVPPDLPDEDLHPPSDEAGRPLSEDDEVARPIEGDQGPMDPAPGGTER